MNLRFTVAVADVVRSFEELGATCQKVADGLTVFHKQLNRVYSFSYEKGDPKLKRLNARHYRKVLRSVAFQISQNTKPE